MHTIRLWFALLITFGLVAIEQARALTAPEAAPVRVLMVASDPGMLHERVLTAMARQLREVSVIRSRALADAPDIMSQLRSFDCRDCLIVTSGVIALRMVLEQTREARILAITVPEETFERLAYAAGDPARVSAVYMDVALNDMLAVIRERLQDIRDVALISHDGLYLQRERDRGHRPDGNPRLHEYRVDDESELVEVFRQASTDAQAILAVPNPRIYNRDTMVRIMLTTYRTATPLIGYSEAMNRAGALISVFASPEMLGEDAGQLIARSLMEDRWLQVRRHTALFSVTVNRQVSRSLGIPVRESR